MTKGQKFKEEKTVVIVKPDGVKRGLVGEVIRRIEQRGLKVIALHMFKATKEQINDHYPKEQTWITRLGTKTLGTYEKYGMDPIKELGTSDPSEIGKMVRGWLVEYMISGPMVRMVIQGIHAVDMVRKLCGNTLPFLAEMGTIRGDYSVDSPALANSEKRGVHNIVHASENSDESSHEIEFWFDKEDIHEYKRAEDDIMF